MLSKGNGPALKSSLNLDLVNGALLRLSGKQRNQSCSAIIHILHVIFHHLCISVSSIALFAF